MIYSNAFLCFRMGPPTGVSAYTLWDKLCLWWPPGGLEGLWQQFAHNKNPCKCSRKEGIGSLRGAWGWNCGYWVVENSVRAKVSEMTQPASTAEPRWASEIKQILLKILVSVTVTSTHRSQTICLFQNAWEAGEQPEAGPEQRPADELPPLLVCQLVGSAEGQFVILSVTWIRTLRSLC